MYIRVLDYNTKQSCKENFQLFLDFLLTLFIYLQKLRMRIESF
jgi:hypothetical protein